MDNFFDSMPYLQQMNDHFRKVFGDDFVKNLMQSMQGGNFGMGGANPFAATAQPAPATAAGQPQAAGADVGGWPPFGGPSTSTAALPFPVDIVETRHELVLLAELPGLERASDVRLAVYPDQVIVRGERKRRLPAATEGKLMVSERTVGPFERSIPLPTRVRRQHAKAIYQQGLLEVRLLKEGKPQDADASVIDIDFA